MQFVIDTGKNHNSMCISFKCLNTMYMQHINELLFAGSAGVLWFVFWFFLGYSSPVTHPRISKAERLYIESSIASEEIIHDTDGRVS